MGGAGITASGFIDPSELAATVPSTISVAGQTEYELRGVSGAQSKDTVSTGGSLQHADAIEEIVVTAQKREQRLSDVPMTITAVTGEQLARQGITSPNQLERVVPGFSVSQSTFGTPLYTLRGVGFIDSSIGSSPAVAIYMDQVPVPYSVEARGTVFDLERVEVLNGPQGTLFGQNSTGGAINFIAAKPTKELSGGASLDYGRFNEVNADGFVSGSLAPDLTFRLAGRTENRGDWQEEYAPNTTPAQAGATLGARRFNEGRLLLDWNPADKLSFELNLNGWHDGSDTQARQFLAFSPATPKTTFNAGVYSAFQSVVPVPNDDRLAGFIPSQDYARDDYFYSSSLRSDYNLNDHVKFTSITAYSGYQENSVIDESATTFLDQQTQRHAQIHSFSEEARAAILLGAAQLTAGFNYEDDRTDDNVGGPLDTTSAGIGPFRYDALEEIDRQHAKTYAGFASLDYAITSRLSATLGGRYTKQDRGFEGCTADSGDGTLAAAFAHAFHVPAQPGNCVTLAAAGSTVLPPIITSKLDQDNFSWKGGLNWKATESLLLYGNITKSYKSGSFPLVPGALATQYTPVTQESVLAYETGFKVDFDHRRIQLDGATFYYDYIDKQLQGYVNEPPFGKLPTLVNIPKSRIYGAELQGVIQPISGLRASAGVTYINSRVEQNPLNPQDPFGHVASFVGESFPETPQLTAVTDVEYRFSATSAYTAYVGGGTQSRSSTNAAFGAAAILKIEPYTLLDLRAGLEPANGPWSIEVWSRNVTNRYYTTNKIHEADAVIAYTGFPQTYGVTFRYRFH